MVVSLFAIISCNKNGDESFFKEITFQGEIVETKASIGENVNNSHPVSWEAGDEVWFFRTDATAGAVFSANVSSTKSSFSKRLWVKKEDYFAFVNSTAGNSFSAFYPFSSANSQGPVDGRYALYYSPGKSLVVVDLPSEQQAVAGGIDRNALVISGTTDAIANPIAFHNAVSLLEFSFDVPSGYAVNSVVVESGIYDPIYGQSPAESSSQIITKGEIAGQKMLYCPTAATLIYTFNMSTTQKTAITVNGPLTPLTTYYVSVWPGLKKGFKMTLKGTDGEGNQVSFTRTSKNDLTFIQSVLYPMGKIDATDPSKWTKQN